MVRIRGPWEGTRIAATYLGYRCAFCHRGFTSLTELRDAVWANPDEPGRLAHQACWRKAIYQKTERGLLDKESDMTDQVIATIATILAVAWVILGTLTLVGLWASLSGRKRRED